MDVLAKLQAKFNVACEKQKTLLDRAAADDFKAEEKTALDAATSEIETLEKQVKMAVDAAGRNEPADKVEYKAPVGDGKAEDGLEFKGQILIETPAMKSRRVRGTKQYEQAFDGFLRESVAKSVGINREFLTPEGRKVLNEGTGTQGGFLVPSTLLNEMIKNPPVDLILFPRVRRFITAGNTLDIPVLDQSVNWQGGMTPAWTPEGEQKHVTEPAVKQVTIEVFNVAAYVAITKQLIQDAVFDVSSMATDLLKEAILVEIERTLWVGSGIGQPLGFLTIPGTTCGIVPRATAAQINWADIVNLFVALPRQDWKNAIFGLSPTAWGYIMGWTDVANRPIMTVDPQGQFAESIRTKPLLVSDNASALGVVGDISLLDPRFIGMVIREDIEVIASNIAYDALFKNLTYIRAEMRVGAKPLKPIALQTLSDHV